MAQPNFSGFSNPPGGFPGAPQGFGSPAGGAAAPGAPGAPGGVNIEHKKGEVNELKTQLRNPSLARDPEKNREVVKRVIAYMTLGIDVSKVFSEMIMASATKDIVIKKMVYFYITSYAATNPELSLLAINTLQKDCRDEDPMTRGLALRR